ncbi:MAG: cadmium-translocating P-type ATPase [Sphingobacteriales bacterium]|nr:MAG: cadmium-translocating P-type ATPase [Sphingobacteriales bacterium]
MEKVNWTVEGMTCSNCALSVNNYLQKEGLKNVKVNFIGGDVSFDTNGEFAASKIIKGIEGLGYHVVTQEAAAIKSPKKFFQNHLQRFLFCLPFTALLLQHMLDKWWHIHWLMNPWIQLLICLPVYILGMSFFGTRAIKSLGNGMPNMHVLIALGATAAFVYSLIGAILNLGMEYLFFETTATIITLVFLGEWLEDKTVQTTQKALKDLNRSQKVMANMIAFDDEHKELIFPVENTKLHVGDLILIKSGELVPMDCKILWGEVRVNEALLTGESKPLVKQAKDKLIGGSLIVDGTVKAQVTAVGNDTILSNIVNLVKQAQGEKPPVQQLADKISAVFVPVVISLSIITLLLNYFVFDVNFTHSLMRSIAVLVISCPCAMGLATPAAVAVGLGRAAKNGILFRDAKSLELFKDIRYVVFDKTGTLTKGELTVDSWLLTEKSITEEEFKRIVFSLEKFSNHPIAKCIVNEWKTKDGIFWKKIEEIKGLGIKAEDKEGNIYQLGSFKLISNQTNDASHTAYLLKNEVLMGWIDVSDEIRTEAKAVVDYLHTKGIKTYLLSGDSNERSEKVADALGIDAVIAEQSPEQKLIFIETLTKEAPTAMVGDGINDAPALAKATIGISMSDATQLAMQTAQVVLMNKGIQHLPLSLGLGKHTFTTIKQNLFWAFIYNIIAIPIAALGLLSPGLAALAMGFSDVVLAINSVRLNFKRVV